MTVEYIVSVACVSVARMATECSMSVTCVTIEYIVSVVCMSVVCMAAVQMTSDVGMVAERGGDGHCKE